MRSGTAADLLARPYPVGLGPPRVTPTITPQPETCQGLGVTSCQLTGLVLIASGRVSRVYLQVDDAVGDSRGLAVVQPQLCPVDLRPPGVHCFDLYEVFLVMMRGPYRSKQF